jgi:alanine racemase
MYVYGNIIKIVKIKKGESVSYINDFKAEEDLLIGICDLGYYNGIIKRYKGNEVYINNSKYTIVGNICMNNCFIKIDDKIKLNDRVEFLGDNILLENIALKNNISMHEILLYMK